MPSRDHDYLVVQSTILVFALIFLIVNLGVDIAYAFLNPTDPVHLMTTPAATIGAITAARASRGLWGDALRRLRPQSAGAHRPRIIAVFVISGDVGAESSRHTSRLQRTRAKVFMPPERQSSDGDRQTNAGRYSAESYSGRESACLSGVSRYIMGLTMGGTIGAIRWCVRRKLDAGLMRSSTSCWRSRASCCDRDRRLARSRTAPDHVRGRRYESPIICSDRCAAASRIAGIGLRDGRPLDRCINRAGFSTPHAANALTPLISREHPRPSRRDH